MLLVRAIAAFVALPCVVAGLVPWLLHPSDGAFRADALALFVPGLLLLVWCVSDFYVAGRGTLAPWAPPVSLVRIGAYRWSRNPMYIAVTLLLAGWAVAYRSPGMALYAVLVAVGFNLRVIYGEEPYLARTFGHQWSEYVRRVRRWL
jgi:protein-S-isoprenylcysteine O-methyltransferase Ste14